MVVGIAYTYSRVINIMVTYIKTYYSNWKSTSTFFFPSKSSLCTAYWKLPAKGVNFDSNFNNFFSSSLVLVLKSYTAV